MLYTTGDYHENQDPNFTVAARALPVSPLTWPYTSAPFHVALVGGHVSARNEPLQSTFYIVLFWRNTNRRGVHGAYALVRTFQTQALPSSRLLVDKRAT